jgi:hypothetical protein
VIPAKCERILKVRLESPLAVESDLVHPPKGIYIDRTLVQDRQEEPVTVLNATHPDQVLTRGFPMAHCEPVTLVTPQCKVPNPETMKSRAEHQKVPGEEAAVNISGAMKKRHRKRNIAAERSGQPEKRTRGKCGVRKELVVAGNKMTRREGNFVRKYWTGNNAEQETQKGRAFGKRCWNGLECNNGIRRRHVKEPPHLRTRSETAKNVGGRNKRAATAESYG